MLDHCQNSVVAPPSGPAPGPGWAVVAHRPMPGRSPLAWPAEPSFAEMLGDPVFQQLMASDRVSMESFTGLVSAVRQRLGR
ncbi:MAG TPA: hypothetical protein VN809_14860 [Telmatospirillum sp.]|nr:hypothetical protein [Telmatospirillum sp.]